MSHASHSIPRLARPLLAIAALVLAACGGATGVEDGPAAPALRITGVSVVPTDRDAGPVIGYSHADTLRREVAFGVVAKAVVEHGDGRPPSQIYEMKGDLPTVVLNPTVAARSWLSVDRAIRHRGVEIPAGTNLLAVPAIRDSFDGVSGDLVFSPLRPVSVQQARLRPGAFELAPGPYRFTFRWETAAGERFEDTVAAYVKLPTG